MKKFEVVAFAIASVLAFVLGVFCIHMGIEPVVGFIDRGSVLVKPEEFLVGISWILGGLALVGVDVWIDLSVYKGIIGK